MRCDVVNGAIPIPTSRIALVRMSALIRPGANILAAGTLRSVQLSVSKAGHLILPPIMDSNASSRHVPNRMERYPITTEKTLGMAEVQKIHKQLGRANLRQLTRVIRQGGYDTPDEDIVQMLKIRTRQK